MTLCQWISNILTGRPQAVWLARHVSDACIPKCNVTFTISKQTGSRYLIERHGLQLGRKRPLGAACNLAVLNGSFAPVNHHNSTSSGPSNWMSEMCENNSSLMLNFDNVHAYVWKYIVETQCHHKAKDYHFIPCNILQYEWRQPVVVYLQLYRLHQLFLPVYY